MFADIWCVEFLRRNKELVKESSTPAPGSKDLYFPSQYPTSFFTQCMACLWKQHWSYWRNCSYTAQSFIYTTAVSVLYGSMFWNTGSKMYDQTRNFEMLEKKQDLFNAMGSMYAVVILVGVKNSFSVQPVVDVERTVFYRERAAGMYSAFPYAFAQARNSTFSIRRIPIWWRWCSWVNPVAWCLYGLVASQYGDIKQSIESGDGRTTVDGFVRSYFGFKHDFLRVVAVLTVALTLLFALLFAISMTMFNFQRR
ncbi:unnamed protein product [Sphenostylis stenocarpa]|uniref:ABC-2 type transporter transmembrane domain-containing protein n=1 Tax=Sphenostylis stenocarpa TaxID=92480 RepID=A0AA86V7Z9_9FABA|nr:unnamed protein product [Sphenostylis stenocarpa]